VRIVVTGGVGFIGSHVVDGFDAAGHEVAVVDNLSTGSLANLNPRTRLYEVDVRDRAGLARVFADFRPEVVGHQAAQAKVPVSVADPLFDCDVNLMGGINLLKQCVDHGCRKVIFASTGGALYGEPDVVPCAEDHPIRPLSPYGTSKYCFEQYLATFARTFGLDYTVLRYANVYGSRQDVHSEEGRVVAIFAARMLARAPLTIDGDGEQARDMIHVADVVAANLAALEAGSGVAYNIGTGRPTTVNELFRTLAALTGYRLQANYGPPRRGDVRRIALDCARAEDELGWHAAVSLPDGLTRTAEWFRDVETGTAAAS